MNEEPTSYDHLSDDELTVVIIDTLENAGSMDHGLQRPEAVEDPHRLMPRHLAPIRAWNQAELAKARERVVTRVHAARAQAKSLERIIGATAVFSAAAYALGIVSVAGMWSLITIWFYFAAPRHWLSKESS